MKQATISMTIAREMAHAFLRTHKYHGAHLFRELLDDNDNAIDTEQEPLWEFHFKASCKDELDFVICVGSHSGELIAYNSTNTDTEHAHKFLH